MALWRPCEAAAAMRALACLILLLVALAPTAAAQVGHAVTLGPVAHERDVLRPGEATDATAQATRACAHRAQVLPASQARVEVRLASPNVTVQAPPSLAFPQQVCAQGMEAVLVLRWSVAAAAHAQRDETVRYEVTIVPEAGGLLSAAPPAPTSAAAIHVEVPQPQPADAASRAVPWPGVLGVAAALLGAALARRR